MKQVSIGLAMVGILICWSCAVTDVDRTADLSLYKTFAWGKSRLNGTNPLYKSDLIDSHIKASIKNELTSKGVTYAAKKPDLLVSFEGYTETKDRGHGGGMYYYPYYYPFFSYGFFPYGGYVGGGSLFWDGSPTYYTYTQGTLVLNMRDRKTGKLVWQGLVQGSVDNMKALKKNISKGVKAIMKKYPTAPPTPPSLIPIPKKKIS